jgi:crotonobetainyl-CoA:carnitine CoA-transferase CaiB-like acyl-CoA transferase
MLALEGIVILDLSGGYPPALGTQILGDHGAEVINIDGRKPITGTQPEATAAEARRMAAYEAINRNKKSIVLNLKTESARQIFYELARKADVIVDPFRPGVTRRLGVDYPTIIKINPRIVYCSVTGYGQDGPYASMVGHDPNFIAMAGALNLIGEADRPPVTPLNLLGDIAGAALHTAMGILLALMARNKTGKGQYVDISYMDSVIGLLTLLSSNYFQTQVVPQRGTGSVPSFPGGGLYETGDGKLISLACAEPWLWENLCRMLGKDEYVTFNSVRARQANPADKEKWEEIYSFFKQTFLTKTREEWFTLLASKDIPVGKVHSLDEVFIDPQVIHRQMVIDLEHPTEGKVKHVGIPIKLSDTPGKVRSFAPLPGEHTNEILKRFGYSESRINELRKEGAVG